MVSISFSNANPIPLPNRYTFICLLFLICFKAVLCALLKLSCYFLPIVLDKILLTVCRRFSADVSFLQRKKEGQSRKLNFLDVTIINTGAGKYEFTIHRKNAITNVQIKPHS